MDACPHRRSSLHPQITPHVRVLPIQQACPSRSYNNASRPGKQPAQNSRVTAHTAALPKARDQSLGKYISSASLCEPIPPATSHTHIQMQRSAMRIYTMLALWTADSLPYTHKGSTLTNFAATRKMQNHVARMQAAHRFSPESSSPYSIRPYLSGSVCSYLSGGDNDVVS